MFFNSLDSAVFLWKQISRVPPETAVLPMVNVNHCLTLGARLTSGDIILGQHEISHPGDGLVVQKGQASEFEGGASIERVFYVNDHGHEVLPNPNDAALQALAACDVRWHGAKDARCCSPTDAMIVRLWA
eukprot:m.153721 g.153721  ORF g.153721 m.153721 type:complete len:130 (+) comp17479_c1_seq1:661-1050(+)